MLKTDHLVIIGMDDVDICQEDRSKGCKLLGPKKESKKILKPQPTVICQVGGMRKMNVIRTVDTNDSSEMKRYEEHVR